MITPRKDIYRNAGVFLHEERKCYGKIDELTLEVKIDVSNEMAAACVAILNLYLKDNDIMDVMGEKVDWHYQIHLVNKETIKK